MRWSIEYTFKYTHLGYTAHCTVHHFYIEIKTLIKKNGW